MTKPCLPALRRGWLAALLSLLAAAAAAQSDPAGPAAVLAPGMTALPEPTLVMIDGRENEMFTRRPTFVPGMDIINIHLAHLGGKNFLWRIDFLEPPDFDTGVFNLYFDTDLDAATGIQAVAPETKAAPPPPLAGADLSVTFSRNACTLRAWTAAGAADDQTREVPFHIRNRELYIRTELALPAQQGRVSLAIAANTHSIVTPEKPNPVMRDTTRRVVIHRFELKSEEMKPDGQDSDGDGLPDAIEAIFGTRPDRPEPFTVLASSPLLPAERRAQMTYVAGLDMTEIAVAHVAEDRFLFRTAFAAPPPLADMVHIIYLDTDNAPGTGRDMGATHPGTGTDAMLVATAGTVSISLFGDLQKQYPGGQIRHALVGNHLFFCADLPLQVTPAGAACGLFAITHTAGTPKPPMADSIGRTAGAGIPLVPGPKQPFGDGWKGTGALHRACGLGLIRPLLSQPGSVVIPYDKLELAGFDIDYYTNRQYGHLKALRPRAAAGHTAPKGRYHVGFMIFDRKDGSEIGLRIDNRELARARIDAGNLNYWIYWLPEAREFTGAEYVELVALGGTAPHPVCSLFFSPEAPPQREQSTAVDHLTITIPPTTAGEALVSWVSEHPVPARLEYGIGNFEQVFTGPQAMLVHKARLTGLASDQTYQARAVGVGADGSPVYSRTVTFRPQPRQPPATRAGRHRLPLAVANPHPFPAENWLLRSGIPFPAGALAAAGQVRLLDDAREVPAQIVPAAWWPDGSIKWLTVTFAASAPPQKTAAYALEYGQEVTRAAAGADLAAADADGVLIQTGAASFRVNAAGEPVLPDGKPVRTRIVPAGSEAKALATGELPASVTLEENGPVYARVRSTVTFPDADGKPALTIICRLEAWRGATVAKLSHSVLIQGQPSHSTFESISLEIPVASSAWTASRLAGQPLTLSLNDRAFQRREHELIVNQEAPAEVRLLGDFTAGGNLVVLRHFWEQYPKGASVAGDHLRLELCPDFTAGYYDSFPFDKNSTKIYFYLQQGVYTFRRGLRKTHELLIGAGGAADAALFQRPLLATAPPQWYCDSKAFDDIAPRDPESFPTYEAHADRNFAAYRRRRETNRDYGLLNFGDWFGERGVHWGNSEYDNTAAFLLQYVRSGDPECFFLADEAEKHVRDVDTRNWDPNPLNIGHVYIHQVGHHGGYYDRSPPGEDAWGTGSGSVTHAWSEGHLWHGFLTGDGEATAAGLNAADYFIATRFNRFYDFCDLRDPGWHLIMNAAAYSATLDPVYLNASRVILARVLEFQDTIPRPLPDHQVEPGRTHQVGGWSRMLVPGHCHCEPRHRGNANFMLAILLSGLKYYHAATGDPAAKAALIAGAYYLLDECYSEAVGGFRYTSCPAMNYSRNASPILTEGIAAAFRWTGDQRFAHPLIHGLPASERGSDYGNAYYYRCGPRLLADMKAAGLKWDSGTAVPAEVNDVFQKPQWLQKAKKAVVVQAEDFRRQGGGECQKIAGRPGAWGQIVSYWHADLGHWLEWEVDIPEDGNYAVRFHYATDSPEARRDFRIDGQLPCPQAENIAFPATGGFGMNPFDWNCLALADAQKKDLALPLRKGRHTIRMNNIKDGLAFDFFVLFQP